MNIKDEKTIKLLKNVAYIMNMEDVPSLRAIEAYWSDNFNTINLIYYVDGLLTEEIEYDLSSIGGEVVSQYTHELIHEQAIRLDRPHPLPQGKQWGYLKP